MTYYARHRYRVFALLPDGRLSEVNPPEGPHIGRHRADERG